LALPRRGYCGKSLLFRDVTFLFSQNFILYPFDSFLVLVNIQLISWRFRWQNICDLCPKPRWSIIFEDIGSPQLKKELIMDIKIKEISTPAELRAFIRFPHKVHKGDPNWVPALDFDEMNNLRKDKNPAFDHCQAKYFLAYKDGEIVGRVAAIYNKLHIETWNQRFLRFGWIDFIDDEDVVNALMGAVEDWARELDLTAVHGPLGFTDLDREGLLVEGFDELATLATRHDPPYYAEHLERLGYGKDVDWYEHLVTMPDELDEKIIRVGPFNR
jgi:hypothetical protein